MEIFRLFGSIFIDNEKADKALDATDKKGKGLAGTLTSGIATAAKWGAALGGAAIAAGGALYGMATKAAGTTDRIDKLSQKIGLSRQGFQEWEFILSQSGTDIDKLQVGLKTMVQRMDETVKGTGQGSEMFKKLGISVKDSSGNLKSQEQVFEEVVNAMQKMPEGAEKSRLAFELFGKAGTELMPLLNSATGSVDEMKKMAHDLGMVLSDEAVDAGVLFTDTIDQLTRSFKAVTTQVGVNAMPIIQKFAEWIIDHMPQIQAVIQAVFTYLGIAVNFVVDLFSTYLIPAFQKVYDVVADVVQRVIDWFKNFEGGSNETVQSIIEIFTTLYEILKVIWENIKKGAELIFEGLRIFWEHWGETILAVLSRSWDQIKLVFETAINLIKNILGFVLALMRGDWEEAWERYLAIGETIWNFIAGTFENIFGSIRDVAIGIWKNISDGVITAINAIVKAINWLIEQTNKAREALSKIPGISLSAIKTIEELDYWEPPEPTDKKTPQGGTRLGKHQRAAINPPRLAEGGDITRRGSVLVGERGPEILDLPRGAQVRPLPAATGGITFGRGAFEGAFILDDYGVDRLMDRVMDRLRSAGSVNL